MTRNQGSPQTVPGIQELYISDRAALEKARLPFVRNCGLYVPGASGYRLGDHAFVLLTLPARKLAVCGRVVWIIPRGAQGWRPEGIGIQVDAGDHNLRIDLENLLATQ